MKQLTARSLADTDRQVLEVHFSKPVRTGLRKMSVNVEVAIPLDQIQLLPVDGEWLSVVEIRVTAMDEGGNRSEVSFKKVPIAGFREPQPGQLFYYETDLELRRREHSYVITVHDPLTGTNLTSTGRVGPKSIQESAPQDAAKGLSGRRLRRADGMGRNTEPARGFGALGAPVEPSAPQPSFRRSASSTTGGTTPVRSPSRLPTSLVSLLER
ncbi:MAG: hypothetical protein OXH70_05220 [Acidobacteria bacterium]|nr:hypothetical protein [Acidobacteriota bacterium]